MYLNFLHYQIEVVKSNDKYFAQCCIFIYLIYTTINQVWFQ